MLVLPATSSGLADVRTAQIVIRTLNCWGMLSLQDAPHHQNWRAMHQTLVTALVPAEAPDVFRYLTDPALLPLWVKGLRESRPQGDGVLRVGARSIEVVEAQGKLAEMVTEVTSLQQDRRLGVRVTYPGSVGGAEMIYELTPALHATDVRLTYTPRYRGAARLFVPLMRASTRRRLQSSLDRLVQVARPGAPDL